MPPGSETIQPTSIVNETLSRYPATTGVFNRFGIDACCGGAVSINDAATRDGADPGQLLDALNSAIGAAMSDTGRAV
jgi:iron-sulfur cluster repair protein YtfE (RIC family)